MKLLRQLMPTPRDVCVPRVVKTQLDELAKAQDTTAVTSVQIYLIKEFSLPESTNQDVFRLLVAQANARQNYLATKSAPTSQQPIAVQQPPQQTQLEGL